MGNELSFVSSTSSGCRIQRDLLGGYVVSHPLHPDQPRRSPTLAGAYAACQEWEGPNGAGPGCAARSGGAS